MIQKSEVLSAQAPLSVDSGESSYCPHHRFHLFKSINNDYTTPGCQSKAKLLHRILQIYLLQIIEYISFYRFLDQALHHGVALIS